MKSSSNTSTPNLEFSDEVLILSIVVITGGLGYIDSYYRTFGINYELLDLSVTKVLYQGLKLALNNIWIIGFYLIQIIWILFFKRIGIAEEKIVYPLFYLITLSMIFAVYKSSSKDGMKKARLDMQMETSTLPKIKSLMSSKLIIQEPIDNYLLFVSDEDFITVFKPMKSD